MQDRHFQRPFANTIVQWRADVAQEEGERLPVVEEVLEGPAQAGVGFDPFLLKLLLDPVVKALHDGAAMLLVVAEAGFGGKSLLLGLIVVLIDPAQVFEHALALGGEVWGDIHKASSAVGHVGHRGSAWRPGEKRNLFWSGGATLLREGILPHRSSNLTPNRARANPRHNSYSFPKSVSDGIMSGMRSASHTLSALDWTVVALVVLIGMIGGMAVVRLSSRHGALSYFASDRNLPWWAIAISNTATYQSGNGAFVMLLVTYGLAANWLWWSAWVLWMPLVAIIWAPMWRRMRIVTTAELITLRYGGRPALAARKIYAVVCCLGFSVLLIGYITGFFAQTIAPLVHISELDILLIFGGTTVLYTMFGGLMGVVVTEVLHFVILLAGCTSLMFIAVAQHGGWSRILARIAATRPEALTQVPPVHSPAPTNSIALLTILVLALQGVFFAGSPTAGEGSTAQRFMAARNERHAMGGQLFNCFLALCLRILPLIGIGLVALSMFWPATLARRVAPPPGMTVLRDPVTAWARVIQSCRLPNGLTGLLVAVEVAAYTSTLSALINWGGSFVINDLYRPLDPKAGPRREIWVSRLTSLLLFALASAVAILFVKQMIGWFMFINSAMVIFLLPLAFFRFFWWRFNVWGEMAAIVLGLPLSIGIWFVLDFQNGAKHPMWQGLGLLFALSFVVLIGATLLTPPESKETLAKFYERCQPPGLWGPIRARVRLSEPATPAPGRLLVSSLLGVLACLGLVLATNALFVADWVRAAGGLVAAIGFGSWLVSRIAEKPASPVRSESRESRLAC